MSWITREKDESFQLYYSRVSKMAMDKDNAPIASHGGESAALGLRGVKPDQVKGKTYVAMGVPPWWTPAVFEQLLEANDWIKGQNYETWSLSPPKTNTMDGYSKDSPKKIVMCWCTWQTIVRCRYDHMLHGEKPAKSKMAEEVTRMGKARAARGRSRCCDGAWTQTRRRPRGSHRR